MLTVTKLGLPPELRRSLACTNIIENVMGTVRRVLPEREILALAVHGFTLDWRRHAGSRQGIQAAQGLQNSFRFCKRARRAQGKSRFIERASCQTAKAA